MEAEAVFSAARQQSEALAALIVAIRRAVQSYDVHLVDGLEFSARKWREVAIPLLSKDLQELQSCMANPVTPEHAGTLLEIAQNQLGMAKNLDAFRLDFAGQEHEHSTSMCVEDTVGAAGILLDALAGRSDR